MIVNNIETIDRGSTSGFEDPIQAVFRSSTEFQTFWQSHTSNYSSPVDGVPEVDFETDMVVSVFRGTQSTGGYDIEIKSVKEGDSEITVNYELNDPPPGGMTTCALTQPFHIVKTTRSAKPVSFIVSEAPLRQELYPLFICGVEKEQKVAVTGQIEALDIVKEVQKLFDGEMLYVNFYEDMIDKDEARKLLEAKSGIRYVEVERRWKD